MAQMFDNYHSRQSTVYHDNDDCPDFAAIRDEDRIEGTGGKPLCRKCARLNPPQQREDAF